MTIKWVVYIAGPMRGKDQWEREKNIRRAEEASLRLLQFGLVPICVHTMARHFSEEMFDWNSLLEGDRELIRRSDMVLFMPGWEVSQGSLAEHLAAQALGKPCFFSVEDLLTNVTGKV